MGIRDAGPKDRRQLTYQQKVNDEEIVLQKHLTRRQALRIVTQAEVGELLVCEALYQALSKGES
jgi:hypothetical protein